MHRASAHCFIIKPPRPGESVNHAYHHMPGGAGRLCCNPEHLTPTAANAADSRTRNYPLGRLELLEA